VKSQYDQPYQLTLKFQTKKERVVTVTNTFQRHLPLQKEPDLEKHYEYLLEGSVGCVGILKNWLTRALRVAVFGVGFDSNNFSSSTECFWSFSY